MTPLLTVIAVASVASAFCWVASLVTRDTSWVDRLWSILPVVYAWIFAASAGLLDPRLDVMALLVSLWGARLTMNFARKGGYRGVEDYRWAVLRARMSRRAFAAFNLLFIVLYQNALLVLITLPALTALEHRGTPFGPLDAIATILFLAFLFGETIADQQQWDFHEHKKALLAEGSAPGPRFLQTGLWSVSRHPNFFFEQAQWWTLVLFAISAAGSLQWTAIGALLLTALFVGSTIFTERITRSKYPEYEEYQRRVSPVVPWIPRGTRQLVLPPSGGE